MCKITTSNDQISLLGVIVLVSAVLKRAVVVDINWHFNNLSGSHLLESCELWIVRWLYIYIYIHLFVAVIGQFSHDVIGCWDSSQWLVCFDPCIVSVISVVVLVVQRWLLLRLSKCQSMSTTTVLFRTTLTRTITLNRLLILLGSNHLQRSNYRIFEKREHRIVDFPFSIELESHPYEFLSWTIWTVTLDTQETIFGGL